MTLMTLKCCAIQIRVARFANQKSKFGYIMEGLGMENVGVFS
jgi:hypothetical protein